LRNQIEQIANEKDEEINRLKKELKRSQSSFSPLYNSSVLHQSVNISQPFGFPVNETSFNETIEKNRSAMKRIYHIKQKLR
jgi:hypothetical protein